MNTQPKSIMALKMDRLKDKLWDLKARTSPPVFRCAGFLILLIISISIGVVVGGLVGLEQDTFEHNHVATHTTATTTSVPHFGPFIWSTQNISQGEPYIHDREVMMMQTPTLTAARPEQPDQVTIVHTIVVTFTSVFTEISSETLMTTVSMSTTSVATPTVRASTCTTDLTTSKTGSVMTGVMYCSFTGRKNIYTLCPRVHTDSPGMLTTAPAKVSPATRRAQNPFSTVRVALAYLWNSAPGLGSVLNPKDPGGCNCDCDCVEMKEKLDSTIDLMYQQQQLIEGQRSILNEHRKSLRIALETLANITGAKAREKTAGAGRTNLKI